MVAFILQQGTQMKERFAANHKLLRRKSGEQKNKKITSSTKLATYFTLWRCLASSTTIFRPGTWSLLFPFFWNFSFSFIPVSLLANLQDQFCDRQLTVSLRALHAKTGSIAASQRKYIYQIKTFLSLVSWFVQS